MAVEADQSRYGIVGLGTFVTLLAAHAMMLIGHPIAISPWSVFVYIWQDAAVDLAVAILAALLRRPSWVFTVYFLVVAYAALNVVVARVLPSPLTPAMWAAASTTLSDSIAAYLTLPNALLLLATIAVAAIAPMLAK
jgi:hypothetical protein